MNLSTLLTALTIGIYSYVLVQGSEITNNSRRLNRLGVSLPVEESVVEQKKQAEILSAGSDTLVDDASAVSSSNIQVEEHKNEVEQVEVVDPVLSLEDRRVEVFDSLYFLYEKAVGRYSNNKDIIEWRRVKVQNWPEFIDMSDMNKWSEEDVEFLSYLIGSNSIIIKSEGKRTNRSSEPLVCIRDPIAVKVADEENSPFDYDDESLTFRPSTLYSVPGPKLEISMTADASVELTEVSSAIKAPVKTLKSISKKIKSVKRRDFKNDKVESDASIDFENRDALLAKALEIFRGDTGRLDAEEVDWSLFKVNNLSYHIIPFSTSFQSEDDISSLKFLMKKKYFGFHNPQRIIGRRGIIFQRLYKIYRQVPGLVEIDPFFIKWNDIDVQGWPEGLKHYFGVMKLHEVEQIEMLLDAGDIKFTLKKAGNPNPKKMIKRSEIIDSSFDEEDGYINESFSGKASIEEVIDSSEEEEAAHFNIRSKRKREVGADKMLASETEATENIKKVARTKNSSINKTNMSISDFANESADKVQNLQNDLVLVLENLEKAKETFSQSDRHKRIISEIIKCFNLLQRQANNEILEVSANEILDFLEIFQRALAEIKSDGEIDNLVLKDFVISAVKLRARLAGIKYSKQNGKQVMKIPSRRIRDFRTFGFLQLADHHWVNELDILELSLDSEDSLIIVPS